MSVSAPAPKPVSVLPQSLSVKWAEAKPEALDNHFLGQVTFSGSNVATATVIEMDWFASEPIKSYDPANPTKTAVVNEFAHKLATATPGLAQLSSNTEPSALVHPYGAGGQFSLRVDYPGRSRDLAYDGLLRAAPKPVQDVIAAVKEMQAHL